MTYVAFSIGYTKYVAISDFKYRRLFKYIHIFLFHPGQCQYRQYAKAVQSLPVVVLPNRGFYSPWLSSSSNAELKFMKSLRLNLYLLLFLALGNQITANAANPVLESIRIQVGFTSYQVEVAATTEQRRLGLMFREKLDRDKGMLFVYAKSGDHRIWMKNTLVPLWVIWIDETFRVTSIQRLEPCTTSQCMAYSASTASRYILELGDFPHSIKLNDQIMGIDHLRNL